MRARTGAPTRLLTTVFFTDMVGSTERAAEIGDRRWGQLMARYQRTVREGLRKHGGREVDSSGDGFFATFGQPADAIACAAEVADRVEPMGVQVRSGVHVGQVEMLSGKVAGIGVHIGARLVSLAGPGEILVSSTVRDALAGSEHVFDDRGGHPLKGVPGEWHLYAVGRAPPERPPELESAQPREEHVPFLSRRAIVLITVAALILAAVGSGIAVMAMRHSGSAVPVLPAANQVAEVAADGQSFVRTIEIGSQGPTGVVDSGSVVWVINSGSATLTRIDTGSAAKRTFGVGGTPTGIAMSGGAVWVTTEFGLTNGAQDSVLRFDAADGHQLLPAISIGHGVAGIAADQNGVWVTNEFDDTVTHIDSTTLAVGKPVHVGRGPRAVTVSGRSVWVANARDKTVSRVDAQSGTAGPPVAVKGADVLIAGGGAVWVAGTASSTVARIDAATGALVTTIPVSPGPTGLALSARALWVADSTAGELTRIDPATNAVVGHLSVRGHPEAIDSSGGTVWAAITG